MKIDVNSIKVGNVLYYENKLWIVLKNTHTQPGKGGAYMQVEMKEIKSGTKNNIRFRSSETVEKAHLDIKDYQYLYTEGNLITLMDKDTYEQIIINQDLLGEQLPFLEEGMSVTVSSYESAPVAAFLPENVKVVIRECEPVIKGQTASSSYKPAILENGVRIMVPPFINQGDSVIVKLETLEYVERA